MKADKLVNAALDAKLKGLSDRTLLDPNGIKFGTIKD